MWRINIRERRPSSAGDENGKGKMQKNQEQKHSYGTLVLRSRMKR
jgi:hypothetical protein